ncbi:MAG: hypothetical protein R3Y36_02775 [Spirochaetales bacterium]
MDIKILLNAIPFELERSVCKHVNILLKRRPSSVPFLSGDTYRNFAHVIYDETHRCSVQDIHENDIVFVSSWLLEEFAQNILTALQCPIILLTHQGDVNITHSAFYQKIANDKNIISWFAQNCTLEHNKVIPLPIGLEDAHRHNAGCLSDFKTLTKKHISHKIPKVVVAFTMGTNPDTRFDCYRTFWKNPISIEFPGSLTCRQYRKRLQRHMFVASPEGNGLDCHRMWEAVYLGVVPIVKRNYMTEYFASLNLPIWIIDSWEEVTQFSQEELAERYINITAQSNTTAAYFAYWKEKISEKRIENQKIEQA